MGAEEPAEKKQKAEDGAVVQVSGEKEKKDKKEKKHKDGKDKKEKKEKKEAPVQGKVAVKGKFAMVAKKKNVAVVKKGPAVPKILTKTEDDYEPVNRWWDSATGADAGKKGAKKWDTFEHHGVMFAPDYEEHGIPIKYDGKEIKLNLDAEELATYWCSVKGTPYETKNIFINNFWKEFTKVLPKDSPIKDFEKCDFSPIVDYREKMRQERLERSREEKQRISDENNENKAYYSHAILNGVRERLGAVGLEPPQLFRGRGEHPKQGIFKKRVISEGVTLNIAQDAPIPKVVGLPGHAWKDIVHENTVQWIAMFNDGALDEAKYVGFAATSGIKGQPDLLKYDRARRLLKVVDTVRKDYTKLQDSKDPTARQKATATYFIDKLALRAGGEKDTEEEADTVGCCNLRVEHLRLEEPNIINFDFLGKDSIRYLNTVPVTEKAFANIQSFVKGKKPEDQVFDKVIPSTLNEYFKEFMEDLTAKVFRTFNASFTLQQELDKFPFDQKGKWSQDGLVKFYNDANRQVAILCNHQKAESKTHGELMEKMKAKKEDMEKQIKVIKKRWQALKSGEAKPDPSVPKDEAGCKKKITEIKIRLNKHEHEMNVKEENKTVSLGTSKTNYMDPRITVSWCKKVDLQIERVFPKTTRTKFPWAMHFQSTYEFSAR